MADSREFAHADAERRLGRQLTPGERAIDIVKLDRDLHSGKQRLALAIEAEKRRAIRRALTGDVGILYLSPVMVRILRSLRASGRAHARAELREHGIRGFADEDEPEIPAALAELAQKLQALLAGITVKVGEEVAKKRTVEVKVGEPPSRDVMDDLSRAISGSLDVAGRVVSGALYSGLGEIFEHAEGLFSGWEYTAVMDRHTCVVCRAKDGTQYRTWTEAQVDLPGGGPNPLCLGDGRCRCRLVPVLVDEDEGGETTLPGPDGFIGGTHWAPEILTR